MTWDFRDVLPSELHACFLYEYARESRRIRALAERLAGAVTPHSSKERGSPFMLIQSINIDCARVLDVLSKFSPRMDLECVSWFDYEEAARKRAALAADHECAFKPMRKNEGIAFLAFPERPFLSRWGWERIFSRQEDNPQHKRHGQYEAFQIDWSQGLETVLEDAENWIRENYPKGAPIKERVKGRHSRPQSFYNDALRRLGAMRLLSVHPLKEAIRISMGYQCKNGKQDSMYYGYIDEEGRPQGQTAWDNAIKGAIEVFLKIFRVEKTDGPISYDVYKRRQDLRP